MFWKRTLVAISALAISVVSAMIASKNLGKKFLSNTASASKQLSGNESVGKYWIDLSLECFHKYKDDRKGKDRPEGRKDGYFNYYLRIKGNTRIVDGLTRMRKENAVEIEFRYKAGKLHLSHFVNSVTQNYDPFSIESGTGNRPDKDFLRVYRLMGAATLYNALVDLTMPEGNVHFELDTPLTLYACGRNYKQSMDGLVKYYRSIGFSPIDSDESSDNSTSGYCSGSDDGFRMKSTIGTVMAALKPIVTNHPLCGHHHLSVESSH